MPLREKIIRLAASNEALRPHLLQVLGRWRPGPHMSPYDRQTAIETLAAKAGHPGRDGIRYGQEFLLHGKTSWLIYDFEGNDKVSIISRDFEEIQRGISLSDGTVEDYHNPFIPGKHWLVPAK